MLFYKLPVKFMLECKVLLIRKKTHTISYYLWISKNLYKNINAIKIKYCVAKGYVLYFNGVVCSGNSLLLQSWPWPFRMKLTMTQYFWGVMPRSNGSPISYSCQRTGSNRPSPPKSLWVPYQFLQLMSANEPQALWNNIWIIYGTLAHW